MESHLHSCKCTLPPFRPSPQWPIWQSLLPLTFQSSSLKMQIGPSLSKEGCTADLPLYSQLWGAENSQVVLFLLYSAIHTAFHFNDTWISTCRKPKPEIAMHMAIPWSWFLQTSSRTQNFTTFCGASDVGQGCCHPLGGKQEVHSFSPSHYL